jgi:hypothetical protein
MKDCVPVEIAVLQTTDMAVIVPEEDGRRYAFNAE